MPLTRAPSSPRSPRAAQRVTSGPPALLLPPTLPRAKGLLAARGLGSETLGHCGLSLPVPLSILMPAHVSPRRARALVRPGQWQQGQGAGAALGTFLGLQICTLGSSPPRPHWKPQQLGDSRAGDSKYPSPPSPRRWVLEGAGPLPKAPKAAGQPYGATPPAQQLQVRPGSPAAPGQAGTPDTDPPTRD